jgi:predicted dehydrogenase
MLNIGIIGAGDFGARHARAMAELDDVALVAASRTSPAALEEFTRQFGGRGYLDYRDLLADPAVDAVVIATPHHLHTPVVEAAAAAGKAILLEKPMAPTPAECDAILAAADEAGVTLFLGHINQFAATYRQAKSILESGELGEIVLGVSTMSKFWFEPNRRDWHLDRATGGGMWLTAGIHSLDRLTWLVGSRVERVFATLGTRFHDQDADDAGLIQVVYANGAAGSIVSVGYRQGAPKHLTELTCTRGMLDIAYDGLRIGRNEQWQDVPVVAEEDWMHHALVEEWRAFVAAVEGRCEPAVSGAYARHIMDVVFGAEESARTGAAVLIG